MLTSATRQTKSRLNAMAWYLVVFWQLHTGRWFVLRTAPDWAVDMFVDLMSENPPEDEIECQLRDEAIAEQKLRRRKL